MRGRKTGRAAGLQRGRKRQNSGPAALRKARQGRIVRQLLAAGCEQNIPLRFAQKFNCFFGIFHKDRVLRGGGRPAKEPPGLRSGLQAGLADAGADGGRIGVRRVDDQVKPLLPEQAGDLADRKTAGRDSQAVRLRQKRLAVVRGHAGGDPAGLRIQEFHQFAALCCATEDADFIHFDILSA